MKNVDKLSQIEEKMRKLNSIDINDYVKPRQTGTNTEIEHREENVYYIKYAPYADIKNLDTSIHQTPFLHWSADNGVRYDEEHYDKVTNRLEEIYVFMFVGMVNEYETIFQKIKKTDSSHIKRYEITQQLIRDNCALRRKIYASQKEIWKLQWEIANRQGDEKEQREKIIEHQRNIDALNKMMFPYTYISKLREELREHYITQIVGELQKHGYKDICSLEELTEKQISHITNNNKLQPIIQKIYNNELRKQVKLTEIYNNYARPKLYNSLFYAYCQLYKIASQWRNLYSNDKHGEKYLRTFNDDEKKRRKCLTLLESCENIKVSISQKEGVHETPIKEIGIRGASNNNETVPDRYLFMAYYDLECNDALKWILEREDITFVLEKGRDFDDVKKWLLYTLNGERSTKGHAEKFAKSFTGIYHYIKDCKFIGNLKFHKDSAFYSVTKEINNKGKIIEFIRIFFDLPKDAITPMKNYISKAEST